MSFQTKRHFANDRSREDLVGEALRVLQDEHAIRREDLFLQTKLRSYLCLATPRANGVYKPRFTSIGGQDRSQFIPYDPSAPVPDQVNSSLATSLKNLRTTYLDSYILHSPLDTRAKTLDAWRTLISFKDAGKVRAIGVSNVYDVEELEALEEATGRKVEVVQNRWFQGNGWDRKVYQYCQKHGIQYQYVITHAYEYRKYANLQLFQVLLDPHRLSHASQASKHPLARRYTQHDPRTSPLSHRSTSRDHSVMRQHEHRPHLRRARCRETRFFRFRSFTGGDRPDIRMIIEDLKGQ